jgi:hypothetical protein
MYPPLSICLISYPLAVMNRQFIRLTNLMMIKEKKRATAPPPPDRDEQKLRQRLRRDALHSLQSRAGLPALACGMDTGRVHLQRGLAACLPQQSVGQTTCMREQKQRAFLESRCRPLLDTNAPCACYRGGAASLHSLPAFWGHIQLRAILSSGICLC